MKYVIISTPENIDVEYRLAGVGSRLGARIVDLLIQISLISVFAIVGIYAVYKNLYNYSDFATSIAMPISVFAIVSIVFLYYVFCETLMHGQTFGRKMIGLRVIKENGQPITIKESLVRNVAKLFIDSTGLGFILILLTEKNKRAGDYLASTIVIAETKKPYGL